MAARGKFFITPHAVRRFIERIRPDLSFERALGVLIDLSSRARRVRGKGRGYEVWRTPSPERLRLIVGPGEGALPAVITVEHRCDADAEAQRRRRERARSMALCRQCQKRHATPGHLCDYCRACVNRRSKERYRSRRAAGQCVRCGAAAERYLCSACAEKRRARRRA